MNQQAFVGWTFMSTVYGFFQARYGVHLCPPFMDSSKLDTVDINVHPTGDK